MTLYVAKRDYMRLKEMAEASDIAGKVQALGTIVNPQARQTCWIGNTSTYRHATFCDWLWVNLNPGILRTTSGLAQVVP